MFYSQLIRQKVTIIGLLNCFKLIYLFMKLLTTNQFHILVILAIKRMLNYYILLMKLQVIMLTLNISIHLMQNIFLHTKVKHIFVRNVTVNFIKRKSFYHIVKSVKVGQVLLILRCHHLAKNYTSRTLRIRSNVQTSLLQILNQFYYHSMMREKLNQREYQNKFHLEHSLFRLVQIQMVDIKLSVLT